MHFGPAPDLFSRPMGRSRRGRFRASGPSREANTRESPQGGEFAGLNEIEDLLEQRLTDRNESVMAGVITTDGMREYVFYSSDAEQATAKVEQLAAQIRAVRSQ